MELREIIGKMTLEEKVSLLTGSGGMSTAGIERLNIPPKNLADGPHGVRRDSRDGDCTYLPSLSALAATWDTDMAELYGKTVAGDCTEHNIDMILGPGVNIKRDMLCGRNFEYFSEDPVLAGEMSAAYINGVQKNGVSACLKHFAVNSQERDRCDLSSEVDERTLREIYLKAFEIAVKKAKPDSIMCAYNKINSVWCSENRMLLTEILKDEWGYNGFVISDWGAVQNISKAISAGLDLQMPINFNIKEQLESGLERGEVSTEDIDNAVERVLHFALKPKAENKAYDRQAQHDAARKIAEAGIVLMKNEDALPLNKYKKIAVIGEFADKPLIGGQGSAEVYPDEKWISSPVEELKKALPETEIKYKEWFKKREFPAIMQWPKLGEYFDFISDAEAVVIFTGSMESEDTEKFDRRTAQLNPQYEMFIEEAINIGKKVIVVLQSGGVIIPGRWSEGTAAIVEMWLGGEGAGEAIADVLSGRVSPSGKLPETFPIHERTDLGYPGDGFKVEYREKSDVGYRYYDKHVNEIVYPFGHGLSYTKFEYRDCKACLENDELFVSLSVENTGAFDGAEVVQVYINDPISTATRPIKELKAFKKVFVRKGETERVEIKIPMSDLGYYNICLHKWVTEPGKYNILIGSSSQDIRAALSVVYEKEAEYTIKRIGQDMIG